MCFLFSINRFLFQHMNGIRLKYIEIVVDIPNKQTRNQPKYPFEALEDVSEPF